METASQEEIQATRKDTPVATLVREIQSIGADMPVATLVGEIQPRGKVTRLDMTRNRKRYHGKSISRKITLSPENQEEETSTLHLA